MVKTKYKSIDEYISLSKSDIITYMVLTLLLSIILFVICYNAEFYYPLFLILFGIFRIYEKVQTYLNIVKIKKYLFKNNLLDKIGKIDFWNEQNYILAENYMAIAYNGKIYTFKYDEIDNIYEESINRLGKNSSFETYLHIILQDNKKFKVLIHTTTLVNEKFKDITDYLLNKNTNIKKQDNIITNHVKIYRKDRGN